MLPRHPISSASADDARPPPPPREGWPSSSGRARPFLRFPRREADRDRRGCCWTCSHNQSSNSRKVKYICQKGSRFCQSCTNQTQDSLIRVGQAFPSISVIEVHHAKYWNLTLKCHNQNSPSEIVVFQVIPLVRPIPSEKYERYWPFKELSGGRWETQMS